MPAEAKQHINGERTGGVSKRMAARKNPADIREIVGSYPLLAAEESAVAVEASSLVFPDSKSLPVAAGSAWLHRVAIEFFTPTQIIAIAPIAI